MDVLFNQKMKNRLQIAKFLETAFPLNKEGVEELVSSFKVKEFPKNTSVLNEGQFENSLRFINKGVVREFYKAEKKEINVNFYTTPQFISDFLSFIHTSKTKKSQETLSDTQVLELGKETFLALLAKYSCGQSVIDMTFQNIVKSKELLE